MWLIIALAVIWGTALVVWLVSLEKKSPTIRYRR
jgi:hypothetical protein